MIREGEEGRNLSLCIQGKGPSPGVPGNVPRVSYAYPQMGSQPHPKLINSVPMGKPCRVGPQGLSQCVGMTQDEGPR